MSDNQAVPAVSVILPVYNAEKTLDETLGSIQQQSFQDYELIIVDDGSTDNSADISRRHQQKDSRISVLSQSNYGVIQASNRALKQAVGRYIARMDADDIMHVERLQTQFDFLENSPKIDVVGCQVELFPAELIQGGFIEYIRWQNACIDTDDICDERYVELTMANPTLFIRRTVMMALGGYRQGDFPEDYDLFLRLAKHGYKAEKISQVLHYWRESTHRLTRTDPRYSRDAFDSLRAKYLVEDNRLHSGRPIIVWGAGRKTRQRASLLLEYGIEFEAWVDIDPNKIGNCVQGIPVRAPGCLQVTNKPFVLVYVNNRGARDLIAGDLAEMGYQRGLDYLMVG